MDSVIILVIHTFVIVEQMVLLLVKTAKHQSHRQGQVCFHSSYILLLEKFNLLFIDCPLNCGSGTCVNAGATGQSLYACLCNGTLTPQTCSP